MKIYDCDYLSCLQAFVSAICDRSDLTDNEKNSLSLLAENTLEEFASTIKEQVVLTFAQVQQTGKNTWTTPMYGHNVPNRTPYMRVKVVYEQTKSYDDTLAQDDKIILATLELVSFDIQT